MEDTVLMQTVPTQMKQNGTQSCNTNLTLMEHTVARITCNKR